MRPARKEKDEELDSRERSWIFSGSVDRIQWPMNLWELFIFFLLIETEMYSVMNVDHKPQEYEQFL